MEAKSRLYYYAGTQLTCLLFPFFIMYALTMTIGLSDELMVNLAEKPAFLLSVLAQIILLPIALTIWSRQTKQRGLLEYINLSFLRYSIALIMFFYGYAKMHQKFFEITYLTQDSKVSDVSSFFLTWYFFGRSNIQEVIIGLMEFLPALLLLWRRTWFLGAIFMFPVAANVFLVNLFNHLSPLTLIVSFILALANFYILYSKKVEILSFLNKMASQSEVFQLNSRLTVLKNIVKYGVIVVLAYVFCAPFISKLRQKPDLLFSGRNKIKGGFELTSLSVNRRPFPLSDTNKYYYRNIYLEPQSRWNTVLTLSRDNEPKGFMVKWNSKSDSVRTFVKRVFDVGQTEVDSTTAFTGTYHLEGGRLLVNGIQHGDTIAAVYARKHLKDFDWFW